MKRLLTVLGAVVFAASTVMAADLGGPKEVKADETPKFLGVFQGCGVGAAGGRSNADVDIGGGNLGGDGLAGEIFGECTLQTGGAIILGGRIAYGLNGAEGFGVELDDYYYGVGIFGIQLSDSASVHGLVGVGRQGVKGGPEIDALIYGLGAKFQSGNIFHGPEWQHWDYETIMGADPSEDRFMYRAGANF